MSNKPIKFPYIKPTRRIHDSGWRTFEVGYITLNKENRAEKIEVLGRSSDHIYTDYLAGLDIDGNKSFSINIDLTLDGYLRFWSFQGELVWDNYGSPHIYSDAGLKLKEGGN